MDLAVGMIIGSAFTSIVNSLVTDVIMPLISVLTGGISFDNWKIVLGSGDAAPVLNLGSFVAQVLNFLIIAFVIFTVVKALNKLHELGHKPVEAVKTTKTCPYCKSEISIEATRCPHCTSQLQEN